MVSDKKQEILRLYDVENLTQEQIAYRLEINQSNVSRILKKLHKTIPQKIRKKKGDMVNIHLKSNRAYLKNNRLWRYHALQFTITPFYFYPRYSQIRKKQGNWFIYRDWIIKLHKETIELRLRRGFDFIGKDKYESIALAENSLNRTLYELSNSCGFQFEKEGKISIRLDKQHLSNTNSPLAKSQKGNYIQIKGIDGKVWFLIDKSQGTLEHEYIHSDRLSADSDTIEAFLNDLRLHPSMRFSELVKGQEFNNKAMFELAKQIGLHLEVLTNINGAIKRASRDYKEVEKMSLQM
jgi:hypothetical protein